MSFNSRLVALPAVTGNLNGLAAGTRTGAGDVKLAQVMPGTLSAECTIDCETSTLTMYLEWQVSKDGGSTWLLCANGSQNAATVIAATGTGGADAAVTLVLEPPPSVYSWPLARVAVRNEVTTGATVDTYSVSYRYQRPSFL